MEIFLNWKNRPHINLIIIFSHTYDTSKKQQHAGRREWNGDEEPAAKKSKQINRFWIFF
jgi:hypothetical protein